MGERMDKKQQEECSFCREREVQQLKNDLHKCKDSQKFKDRKIKALDKKVFILTAIAIGMGAIFGKEALDNIVEWLDSIGSFKSGVNNLTSGGVYPAPSALAVFALYPILARPRRRK